MKGTNMFNNPGKTVKKLAVALFFIVMILSFVGCFLLIRAESDILALVVLVGGLLTAFVTTLLLFGFGELIETNTKILETNSEILELLQNTSDDSYSG